MASINGEKVNNAKLVDVNTIIQAGINPKNGCPVKMGVADEDYKANFKKLIRVQDEQDAINSFE